MDEEKKEGEWRMKYLLLLLQFLIWLSKVIICILRVPFNLAIKFLFAIGYVGHIMSMVVGLLLLTYLSLYVWEKIESKIDTKYECIEKEKDKCIMVRRLYTE